jgi:type IV pilus assembly protein PilW
MSRAVSGWSLVELMVALAVGAILSLFAMGLLAGANAGLSAQAEAAMLDDTGNYVMSTIARAVRQSGWGLSSQAVLTGTDEELRLEFAGAGDGSMLNCAGMAEQGATAWSVFRLDGNALRCRYRSGKTWGAQTMANGVESLRFVYGVDTDAVPDGIVNRWMRAKELDAWGDWRRALAVRCTFTLAGKHGKQPFALTAHVGNPP